MAIEFYIASAVAVIATARVIANDNAIHALLYLIVSLLSTAIVFYIFGAPFAAALEVIIYAGAIVVLFVFAIMILSLDEASGGAERRLLTPSIWIGPAGLTALLLGELGFTLWRGAPLAQSGATVSARQVGALLFGPYLLAVELASVLLLAGLVGAYHLGHYERHLNKETRKPEQ
jgi:NADH-quinone oxidoreductase subunit J